ncbi:MAG: DUF4405 domain-containing protein [Acidimicrobiia bacterium]
MTTTHQRTVATAERPRRPSRTKRLFVVDAIAAVLFVLVMNVPLTGVAIHAWLGIAISAALTAHLVQHADWVATMNRRVFSRTSLQNRFNYLLMFGLFFGFASITVSGLLISESALPWLGYHPEGDEFWLWLHLSSVGWVVAVAAMHIAMNWKWIVNATNRFIFGPLERSAGEK